VKCSDIADDLVIRYAADFHDRISNTPAGTRLMEDGVPKKVAAAKVDRLIRRGLLDFGVSPNTAWPTDKGRALL
jgi:hypothetical protein